MKIVELFEAKEKYDHRVDTDENGEFKTDFKSRSYEKVYDDVKRIILHFVISRMKGDKEDANFYAHATDNFHTDYYHGVTEDLVRGKDLDSILENAYNAVDEIKDKMSDRYGKIDGGSHLSSMVSGNAAITKKLQKRTGGNLLDMEMKANQIALEKVLATIPEYAEAERESKWHNAKNDFEYAASQKRERAQATGPAGLKKAVEQFDKAFDKAFSTKTLKKVQNGDHGYYFEDWGFSKENPPKTIEDLFTTLKNKHGWRGILEWVDNHIEGGTDFYHIGKSKKALDYLVANSTKLEKFR